MDATEIPQPPYERAESAALAHAVRHWEAGTETAQRLTGRSNAILALIVAVLGYGIWQVDALDAVQPWILRRTMRALLGLALVLMLAALVVLLVPPRQRESRWLPSAALGFVAYGRGDWTRKRVLEEARHRTERANRLIARQNEQTQVRTNEAQALFLSAALCAGAAVLCYLFFSA